MGFGLEQEHVASVDDQASQIRKQQVHGGGAAVSP
jgi:hypothetical protein